MKEKEISKELKSYLKWLPYPVHFRSSEIEVKMFGDTFGDGGIILKLDGGLNTEIPKEDGSGKYTLRYEAKIYAGVNGNRIALNSNISRLLNKELKSIASKDEESVLNPYIKDTKIYDGEKMHLYTILVDSYDNFKDVIEVFRKHFNK